MRRRLLLPALLLALTAGGAACSGDPEPIVEPAPSTTPSASPDASVPTPTAEPESESAKEFIRRWQAAAFGMQRGGETREYRGLTANCESCDNLADSVESIYRDGGTIKVAGDHRIDNLQRVGRVRGTLIFEYVLESPKSRIVDATGEVERRFNGGSARYQVNVVPGDAGWRVSSAVRLAS